VANAPPPRRQLPFHYGWVIVLAGTLTTFACLGLGRFALGMLLPSMAADLHLGYARMGLIGTANFLGYLLAVLASGLLVVHTGARRLICGAILLVGCSMLAISRAGSFLPIVALYFFTGLGSGAANVPMMSLVASWFGSRIRGRAAGFIVSGSGFAILLSGQLIPALTRGPARRAAAAAPGGDAGWAAVLGSLAGAEGWRLGWFCLGMIVIAVAGVNWVLVRNRPADLGLEPHGGEAAAYAPPAHHPRGIGAVLRRGALWHVALLYFLFGFTYVIYATFIVTVLVKERGFPESVAGQFWAAVGVLSLFSGPVFGTLSDRIGRKAGLAIVFGIQAFSYALAASGRPGAVLLLSIFCYGVVVWSIPSIMTAITADLVGPAGTAAAFGFITFVFGIGQMAGPAVAGAIADATGSFSGSFLLSAGLAGLAAALSLGLRSAPPARG
jgi:MFS family permease